MQCPACSHNAPQEAFGNPLRCPECGCFYEKAVQMRMAQQPVQQPAPVAQPAVAIPRYYMACVNCRSVIHQNSKICPKCAYRYKRGSAGTIVAGVIVGLVVLVLIGALNSSPSRPSTGTARPEPALSPRETAFQATELVDYSWRKEFGSTMEASFTIRNNGAKAIKDIEIECIHFAPSGTRIDSNKRTIYEVIEPGKTRVFKDFSMGFMHSQADSSNCKIKSIQI